MPVQQCTALLSDRLQLNEKFIQLIFEMKQPHEFNFKAGQYVSFAIPGQQARRSYSIASGPENTHGFELLIDVTPHGIGTTYLDGLKPGDEVSFLAPMGVFFLAEGEQAVKEKALVFVATGSGIAPMRSMITELLQHQQDKREIWLYWGLRFAQDLFWTEEFEELQNAFPNFHFHVTLSQAEPEWPLCRGRVTDCLRIHELPAEAGYYLCGNSHMIEDVKKLLLEEKQIPKESVHHEKFY